MTAAAPLAAKAQWSSCGKPPSVFGFPLVESPRVPMGLLVVRPPRGAYNAVIVGNWYSVETIRRGYAPLFTRHTAGAREAERAARRGVCP